MKHFRLPSLSAILLVFVAPLIFAPASHAAVVTTLPADSVNATNATLNATVNPGGVATMAYFEYGMYTNDTAEGTIPNPGFEANSYTVFPGYASSNSGVINGWTISTLDWIGLNPADRSPFANNGATPDGANVAFIQSNNGQTNTLSTIISNLVGGKMYRVSFRANSRSGYLTPAATWSLNGGPFVAFTSGPSVGGTNAYYTNSATFMATSSTAAVALQNYTATDSTVLVDAFSIVAVPFGQCSATNNLAAGDVSLTISNLITDLQPGTTYYFRVVADNGAGTVRGETFAFTTDTGVPTTVTSAATGITATNATLTGTVNLGGLAATACFQYGTDTNYGSFTVTNDVTNAITAISSLVSNLSPGTLYHFRLVATTSAGSSTGDDLTFTTPPLLPVVAMLPASPVSATNATLHATVNPGYGVTAVYFKYGVTAGYGSFSSTNNLPATNTTLEISNIIENLAPGTLYHFQIVAINDAGQASGTDQTFMTGGAAPTVTTLGTTGTTTNTTTLSGTVNPNGLVTMAYFQYGTDANYGSFSTTNDLAATNKALSVSSLLSNLSPGTLYHFRLVAENSTGINSGADQTFTTVRLPMLMAITNAADSGPGTLRQAISDSVPGDTIVIDPALSGSRIQLTSGQLVLTNDLIIDGSTLPQGIKIDGNGSSRIFQINAGATVVLSTLTLTNGGSVTSGGAIFNSGNLMLDRCTLAGNSVIGNPGAANGGAGGMGAGGAVYNAGTLTVNQCTMAGNVAKGGAGGKGAFGFYGGDGGNGGAGTGGAIYNTGTLAVNQSTLASNSASGGSGGPGGSGFAGGGATGSQGSAEGGGIRQANSMTLFNSIVAGNSPDTIVGSFTATGNNRTSGNPQLSSLGNNGGPTPTMVLLAGSPAFDAGAPTAFTNDQRGFARVMGTAPDLGAVEMVVPDPFTLPASDVTTTTGTLNGTVNPNGLATTVYFQYGTTTNYGSFTSTNTLAATNVPLTVSLPISNLQPGSIYYFRIVVTSSLGLIRGSNVTFTTDATAPTVTTVAVTGVTATNATLKALVNPNGAATAAYFEYGTSTSYGGFSATNVLAATNMAFNISTLISDLSPGVLYHFRAVAVNQLGITTGTDFTFVCRPVAPAITTLDATGIFGTKATLNGMVNPGNGAATVYFLYSSDTNLYAAGTIPNPSFETNHYTVSPGYAGGNGNVISGWTLSSINRVGLNPANNSPFADNGVTPDGTNVAFIQSNNNTNSLSTTLSNLVIGNNYTVSFRANCRTLFTAPNSTLSVNGGPFVPFTSSPAVGGTNAYYTNSVTFMATNTTSALVLQNFSTADSTVLLDAFSMIAPPFLNQAIALAATNAAVPVSSMITGLQPGTTYYFYIVTINSEGVAASPMSTFTTGPAEPTVTTLPATEISNATATLNSAINSSGAATITYFEYGLTSEYGSFSGTNSLTATNTAVAVSNLISNLLPGMLYHFRSVASNVGGVIAGSDLTFTTAPIPPAITALPAIVLGTNAANGLLSIQLSATINPNGDLTTGYFEYGLTSAYAASNTFQSIPAGILAGNGTATISLSPGYSFHWRVVAVNGLGSAASPDQTLDLGKLQTSDALAGDLNGDGVVSQSELQAVYGNYVTNSPWLYMTNMLGLGETNVSFELDNSIFVGYTVQVSTNLIDWMPLGPARPRYLFIDTNAPALPQRYYRLSYP